MKRTGKLTPYPVNIHGTGTFESVVLEQAHVRSEGAWHGLVVSGVLLAIYIGVCYYT